MFGLFLIPKEFEERVIRSWEEQEPSIYGRFDLAYDGTGAPKLLEYNADTPTALLEASVIQWFWLKDVDERGDQFNSIHERLIEAWQALRQHDERPIHFAAQEGIVEDYVTVEYLRDTAMQAGFDTQYLDVEQIGWDAPGVNSWTRRDCRWIVVSSCILGNGWFAKNSDTTCCKPIRGGLSRLGK